MNTTTYKTGSDIRVGDVIDVGAEGFSIVRFGVLDSPLEPVTGPGRIAYNHRGEGMAVHDTNRYIRVRVSS